MRRMICFALFGLLASSEAAFSQGQHWVPPRGTGPRFGWHPGIGHRYHHFPRHHYFDPFRYFVQDFTTAYSAPEPIVPYAPTYYFMSTQSSRHPRLVFKDHLTYTVEDYWRVDDQLHFVMTEDGGTKSMPFADLDVQATTDLLAKQGFKFRVREEPIEQWLRHRRQSKKAEGRSRTEPTAGVTRTGGPRSRAAAQLFTNPGRIPPQFEDREDLCLRR